jgi:hypothetical protein
MKHEQRVTDFVQARRALADVREFLIYARTIAENRWDRPTAILWHQFGLDLDCAQFALRRLEAHDAPSLAPFRYIRCPK